MSKFIGGELGEMLRRERIRRKETQDEVAVRFGVKQPSYAKWEQGFRPSDARLADIASFLGLDLSEVWRTVHGETQAPATLDEVRKRLAALERDIVELREGNRQTRKTYADMRALLDELKATLVSPPTVAKLPVKPQQPTARRPRRG